MGYPLEIMVIVNDGSTIRCTRGAIFSYHEFIQPISQRLTDEAWREMLINNPPDMPEWMSSFMDLTAVQPDFEEESPHNLYGNSFICEISNSKKDVILSDEYLLKQNCPNPFNAETAIHFELSKKCFIKIKFYNLLGEILEELGDGLYDQGNHYVNFNANHLSSGVYFYSMEVREKLNSTIFYYDTKKMVLIK